jgi:hypothetical protein
MIDVLMNKLLNLCAAVFVRGGVVALAADERNFSPHDKAVLVARVVKVLAVLIMREADCVCAELRDDFCVLIMILAREGYALAELVLMARNAAKGH